MTAHHLAALYVLYALSGFAALTLQVVWQRVIGLNAGVDLFSVTTVIAAFMAGLGIGSVLGGAAADRFGARRSLVAFALTKLGLAVFGVFSIPLLHDGYRALAPRADSLLVSFLFHFALLLVPTTLMGVSLPLLSRAVVRARAEMAERVGRLYSANTLGAAAGAGLTGWVLLGELGFTATVWVASLVNLIAGGLVFVLWRSASEAQPEPDRPAAADAPAEAAALVAERPVWPWMLAYGLTGAAGLGLELVFFRLIDGVMRAHSYSFGHVLSLYLLFFGVGLAWGARRAPGARRPDRGFLWLQFAAGVASVVGVLLLYYGPALLGAGEQFERYYASAGFAAGIERPSDPLRLVALLFSHFVAPVLLMGAPVLLMGASFSFVHAHVARRVDILGRRTGYLLAANIVGNVGGTLLAGFVLIDAVGTSGTLALLGGGLSLCGLLAAGTYETRGRRIRAGVAALAVVPLFLAFPGNRRLWGFLHAAPPEKLVLLEDRTCVNALVPRRDDWLVYINATEQNGYPYDDFHVLIGLLPSLMHERPRHAFAVGLGAGSTAYGLAQDPRIRQVRCVEICAGQKELLAELAELGSPETARLLADPRVSITTGDGRKALMMSNGRYDVITVDALRPQSAYSGNIYSVEFYELVRSRLAPGGLFSQWLPSDRTRESLRSVFPYMLVFEVSAYHGSRFVIAGSEPIRFDRAKVLARLASIDLEAAFPSGQHASLRRYLSRVRPEPLNGATEPAPEPQLNRDLHPRDEYFLNN